MQELYIMKHSVSHSLMLYCYSFLLNETQKCSVQEMNPILTAQLQFKTNKSRKYHISN